VSIDKALFRQVAGSFASGVTVITTGAEGKFHGMTASAFTSLSIDPTLIIVCVDRLAETYNAMHAAGRFNVNILAADQEHLSRTFASKDSPHAHGLVGIDYKLGELGLPILDGALAFLECRIREELEGGDHIIFVGEVDNAGIGEIEAPLLYFRGRYRTVGELPMT
jgi:3-hydroxy-9,10-secoandrosta-1,3,5(10)-triene-9,17-dione monooxygenase reductase component